MRELLFTFPSTKTAIAGEKALLKAGLAVKVMPMPEALSQECGICLRLDPADLDAGKNALAEAGIPIREIYRKEGNMLSSL